jgi:hypothetical protein
MNILTTTHSISTSTIAKYLTIVEGDMLNLTDIAKALVSPTSPAHLVDTIYTGVGNCTYSSPKQKNNFPFTAPRNIP